MQARHAAQYQGVAATLALVEQAQLEEVTLIEIATMKTHFVDARQKARLPLDLLTA
jgi:hypothetical protein